MCPHTVVGETKLLAVAITFKGTLISILSKEKEHYLHVAHNTKASIPSTK